jgi:hypothetical protein
VEARLIDIAGLRLAEIVLQHRLDRCGAGETAEPADPYAVIGEKLRVRGIVAPVEEGAIFD